jgi:hypothetical protein
MAISNSTIATQKSLMFLNILSVDMSVVIEPESDCMPSPCVFDYIKDIFTVLVAVSNAAKSRKEMLFAIIKSHSNQRRLQPRNH